MMPATSNPQDVESKRADEVRTYLVRHPDLAGIPERIYETARQEFGPDASLSLELYRDPEIEDEYLALYVRLRSYGPDTLQRIRAVCAAHESELWDKSGSILVTTDFRLVR
jgi:hypothetical protein